MINIIVALIGLAGTLLGAALGFAGRNKKQAVADAVREQHQADNMQHIFTEMTEIKKRLDTHNNYAKKLGSIEKSLIALQKDIEYLKGGK